MRKRKGKKSSTCNWIKGYKLHSTHGTKERAKHEVGELKFFSPRVKIRVKKLTASCFEANEKYGVYTRGKSVFL